MLLILSRSLSEIVSSQPSAMLLLLACIFLSKFLISGALWAAVWCVQRPKTATFESPDSGDDPEFQLQALTGKLQQLVGGCPKLEWWGGNTRGYLSIWTTAEQEDTWEKRTLHYWRYWEMSSVATPFCDLIPQSFRCLVVFWGKIHATCALSKIFYIFMYVCTCLEVGRMSINV